MLQHKNLKERSPRKKHIASMGAEGGNLKYKMAKCIDLET